MPCLYNVVGTKIGKIRQNGMAEKMNFEIIRVHLRYLCHSRSCHPCANLKFEIQNQSHNCGKSLIFALLIKTNKL